MVHCLSEIQLAGFAPAFTLLQVDSELLNIYIVSIVRNYNK